MALLLTEDYTFLKPLYVRSTSQDTLVPQDEILSQLEQMPTEIFTMIAMSSGFHACMNLRRTCTRFRQILKDRCHWRSFTERSPDVIETTVTIETRLHQFDQIIFGEWSVQGEKVPCIIHRTFLEQYDFLGGLSLVVQPSGRCKADFFDQREALPCYIKDVKARMAFGSLPTVTTSEESPVGGLRVSHSCSDCAHYDNQTVLRSEFVHRSLSEGDSLSHSYQVDPKHIVHAKIQEVQGVFGYSNDVPCVSVQITSINAKPLSKGNLNWYYKYIM